MIELKFEMMHVIYLLLCTVALIYAQFISKFIERNWPSIEYKQKVFMFIALSIATPILFFVSIFGVDD
jgi:small-conductance mechanosensitive channel|tara:strand:- start:10447 stop:10650 length:204 start_codon:yes stop_codon:yes gene_type:complete